MRNVRFESKTTSPHWKSFRVLGVLFCLIVLTAGFAGAAGASGIDITLGTPAYGDNWAYDSLNETLTLNGGTWDYINVTGVFDLTIVLNGTNNITGGFVVLNIEDDVEYHDFYSIYVMDGNLTIQNGTDGGLLNVTAAASQLYAAGIYVEGNIIFESGTVEIDICGDGNVGGVYADGAVSISGGQVNIEAEASGDDAEANGICADEIKILGGTVNADVTATNCNAYGIYAWNTLSLFGGEVSVNAKSSGSGVYSCGVGTNNNIEISDGELNIEAEASGDITYVDGIYAMVDIEISGGQMNVEAEASGDDAEANGIYADEAYIGISGGQVNVEATASGDYSKANGIYADYDDGGAYIEISGGTVKIGVTSETDSAFGIYAQGLTISGGAMDVDATSESSVAEGISVSDLTISDGAVDVDVSSGEIMGFGIYALDLTISGGSVTVVVESEGGYAEGISSIFITITGGDVKVSAESKSGDAEGISSLLDMTITGGEVEEVVNGVVFDLTPKFDNDRSSKDTGAGNYYSYPRTTENGGDVSFGTSRVVSGVTLPEGSSGAVVLNIDDISDWPDDTETPFTFDISVENIGEGAAYINFRISEEKLTTLEVTPADIAVYHEYGVDWVKLTTTFEIKDSIVYYTAETFSFSPFKLVVEESGASQVSTEEPVDSEIIEPVIPDIPQEILPPIEPPVKDEEPETPMPILAVLAGLGVVVLIRRK